MEGGGPGRGGGGQDRLENNFQTFSSRNEPFLGGQKVEPRAEGERERGRALLEDAAATPARIFVGAVLRIPSADPSFCAVA